MDVLIFLGSAWASTPPRPERLGRRVARACQRSLSRDGWETGLVDPLDLHLGAVFEPHFA